MKSNWHWRRLQITVTAVLVYLSVFSQVSSTKENSGWTIRHPFSHKVFIENKGQFTLPDGKADIPVKFGFQEGDLSVYFSTAGIYFHYRHFDIEKKEQHPERENRTEEEREVKWKTGLVELNFLNHNPHCSIIMEDSVPFYFTYALNGDYRRPVKASASKRIIYQNIYPYTDLQIYFHDSTGLKYVFVLYPGADASAIKMQYANADVSKLVNGDLQIVSSSFSLSDHAPRTFQKGEEIPSAFTVEGNIVAFALEEKTISDTTIIDPWITSPALGGATAAYDIECDLDGYVHVFGGDYPFREIKYDLLGNIMWVHVTTFSSSYPYYGDFTIDPVSGSSYIVEGFNSGKLAKLDRNGIPVTMYQGNNQFRELWRVVYNNCTKKLIVGGSSWSMTFSYQVASVDTNLTALDPVNILSAPVNEGTHDVALLSIDNDGDCFMLVAESAAFPNSFNNVLMRAKASTLFPPNYIIKSNHKFPESGYLSFSGGGVIAGMNGMAVNNRHLFTYDGKLIQRWKKKTGALLGSSVIGNVPYTWGGIAASDCGSLYVGVDKSVRMYDSAFNPLSVIPEPDVVYDVKLGASNMLYVCGKDFVAAHKLLVPPCAVFNWDYHTKPCPAVGSATVAATGGTPPYTYYWDPGGNTTNYLYNVEAGFYMVTLTDASCIPNRETYPLQIQVYQHFIYFESKDTVCSGSPVTITAKKGVSYSWFNGSASPSITVKPDTTTEYWVKAVNEEGCKDSLTKKIYVLPWPIAHVDSPDTICRGDTTTLTAGGGYFYTWSNGAKGYFNTVSPQTTTVYSVEVSNGYCSDTGYAKVLVSPTALTADVISSGGIATQLIAKGGKDYFWFPYAGLSCTSCDDPYVALDSGTVYCVAAIDTNGCRDTACVEVALTTVYIPNAFTPNENGLNEVFKPVVKQVSNYQFFIYNRWGELVFETSDTQEGWNGTSGGKKCQQDVYIYRLIFKDDEKEEDHEVYGKFFLIR